MDLICLFRYILLEILSTHQRTQNNISISFIAHHDEFNKGCLLKDLIYYLILTTIIKSYYEVCMFF